MYIQLLLIYQGEMVHNTAIKGKMENLLYENDESFSYLETLIDIQAVAFWGNSRNLKKIRIALSKRHGPIIPLMLEENMSEQCIIERHICIDTTAAGGNVTLLSGVSSLPA